MGDVFITTATISGTEIIALMRAQYSGKVSEIAREARPDTLAEADTMLAAHGLRRVQEWDLGPRGTVTARVTMVDNLFGGTRAARLGQAVGTTHEAWQPMPVQSVQDGDLISDMDLCAPYVVAGWRSEGDTFRVHMVGEGQVWDERHTTDFPRGRFVQVARRKA
ncbi:MAG: hypothetical protein PHQ28_14090 [Mycobacterium sp.]|nr:hypothetical protein [Mycobacterium sp.]